jgi:hypothetical protein
MSEGSYLHEVHNVTLVEIIEEAMEHVNVSNVEDAVFAIERAVLRSSPRANAKPSINC